MSTGGALEPVLDTLAQVRQQLRAAAINTNQQVNDYLQAAGAQAQAFFSGWSQSSQQKRSEFSSPRQKASY